MFDSYFKNRNRNKILKEYKSIKDLYSELMTLKKSGADEQTISAQYNIILNNYKMLINMYKDHEVMIEKNGKYYYFNFNGSEPRIIDINRNELYKNLSGDPIAGDSSFIFPGMATSSYMGVFELIERFKNIRMHYLKSSARKKLLYLLDRKMERELEKIIEERYPENGEVIRNFVFKRVKEGKDEITNQINRVELLLCLPEVENIAIEPKYILSIQYAKKNNLLEDLKEFLLAFKQNSYDFILETK